VTGVETMSSAVARLVRVKEAPLLRPWFRAGLCDGAIVFVGDHLPEWLELIPDATTCQSSGAKIVVIDHDISALHEDWAMHVANLLRPGGMVFCSSGVSKGHLRDMEEGLRVQGLVPYNPREDALKRQGEQVAVASAPLAYDLSLLSQKEQQMVQELQQQGSLTFRAMGGSMRPAICDGDWVRIEPVSPNRNLSVGRIVFLLQPERCVVHPIRQKVHTGQGLVYLCRGLRVQEPDLPVLEEAILGVLADHWSDP